MIFLALYVDISKRRPVTVFYRSHLGIKIYAKSDSKFCPTRLRPGNPLIVCGTSSALLRFDRWVVHNNLNWKCGCSVTTLERFYCNLSLRLCKPPLTPAQTDKLDVVAPQKCSDNIPFLPDMLGTLYCSLKHRETTSMM
jgi:hypothetical protein